ncbi:MAG TPA: DUF6088 family protein [Puia sp.]|nr:DUF6088 family protein [Puia sp.]
MSAETITRSVTEKVKEAKPGTVFFPSDLLEFGAPDAIHQTFSRLARSKTLLRLAKGIYVKPTMDPELGALRPSLEDVAKQIAERDKVMIRPTGAAALNKLGLSTQVPTKVVYMTNGNPKRIQVGRSTIVFKKTTHKQLAVQPETVFLAIQALIALREQADDPDIIRKLTDVLGLEKPADVREGARLAPQRIGRILYQIANNIEKA